MDTTFLLFLALVIVVVLILRQHLGGAKPEAKRAAKKIHKQLERLYAGRHEFRSVTPAEFPSMDPTFYGEAEAWLAEQGFTRVGELEDLVLSEVYPNLRTFIRVFVSKDGAIAAACFDIQPRGWMKVFQWLRLLDQDFRTLEFETEFTNGTFLRTSNARDRQMLNEAPSIAANMFPADTPFEVLLAEHRAVVNEWCAADENFVPVHFSSLEDVIESQHRGQDITNAWRKEIGYVTPDEMARMASPGAQGKRNAENVMREINRINERKRPGPPPLPR